MALGVPILKHFRVFLKRNNFVTSGLLSWMTYLPECGILLQQKDLLQQEKILSFRAYGLRREAKMKMTELIPLKCVLIYL